MIDYGIGLGAGAFTGYKYAKANNLDLWSGKTLNTETTNSTSLHATQRAAERGISQTDINDALNNPLQISDIKFDSQGRPSVKYIGQGATVIVNLETGNI